MHISLYSYHLAVKHTINVIVHESFNIISKDKHSSIVKEGITSYKHELTYYKHE
jgi:hypothetical protein